MPQPCCRCCAALAHPEEALGKTMQGCGAEAHLLYDDLAPVICGCYGPIILKADMKRLAVVWRLASCAHSQLISLHGRGL